MKKLEALIGLITFTGLSFCVCAQEVTNSPARESEVTDRTSIKTSLKPVVVTADPLSGDQADIAQPVSVLQREDRKSVV